MPSEAPGITDGPPGDPMLKIRAEQERAFRTSSLDAFVARTEVHLHRYFPVACRTLGPEGVRQAILEGIDRARVHRFTAERDVSRYVDIMFVYGRAFDRDPRLPFAARILADPEPRDPGERMDRLAAAALAHEAEGTGIHA